MDRSMARAIAWNASARWLAQIFSWGSTIVVARLLSPYDYGIVGMAGLYLNLALLVGQGGVGDAILVFRDLSEERVSQLNTIALLTGIALVAVSFAVAYPFARFFSAPPLFAVILVSSVWYVFSAFQVVPRGLLQKELRFKLLAGVETVRAFFQAVVTIVFALLKFRYWSLVIGYLGGSLIASILILYWKRQGYAWPHWKQLRQEIKYSVHVLLSRVAFYAYDNADFGVAGRVLGEVPLGNYTVAWTISSAPVEKIANLVMGVTPAYFSAIQKDQAELRRYLARITETLSFVTIPASIGLALCADLLVPVLLGPKWSGAVAPLRLLGIFVAARSITLVLPNLLTAVGDAGFVMKATVGAALFMPLAFLAGSRWGTTGIAAAWVFAYPIITIPLLYRTLRATGMRWTEYIKVIAPSVKASLIMALAVLGCRKMLLGNIRPVFELIMVIALGILSYSCALFAFHRERVNSLIKTAKSVFGR
jgi:O-antigen/teichoic acid export membrane protein